MKDNELFDQLVSQNNIWDAQLVGKNLFCKNPFDKNIFELYFDFCIKVCLLPIEIETRRFFSKEAELSLSIFSEKAEIDVIILAFIEEKRQSLVKASHLINETIHAENSLNEEKISSQNQACLEKLIRLKGAFLDCTSQNKFDELITQLAEVEDNLIKDSFSDIQKLQYDSLTKDFSTLVSQSMARISQSKDIEYNRSAASSFKKAFDLFKGDTETYIKSDSKLYELVAHYLFAYDAKRLFNETLVYYNHVYTYIFNKLNDEGKYRFTQFSFDTPKV